MKKINKKVLGFSLGLVFVLACLLVYLLVVSHASKDKVQTALTHVEAYVNYDLIQDGKVVLTFGQDTIYGCGCFVDKWAYVPSCQGRMVVNIDNSVWHNKYKKMSPILLLDKMINIQDSIYKDSKWKVSELKYYLRSHNVTDEGYNMISNYETKEQALCDSSKKMLDSLRHIKKGQNLKIAYRHRFYATCLTRTGQSDQYVSKNKSGFMGPLERVDHVVGNIFQLHSKKLPDGANALLLSQGLSMVGTHVSPLSKIGDLYFVLDSYGHYQGEMGKDGVPNGHGLCGGFNGSYYEGSWLDGKKNGYGFSVAYQKPLRAGEWKNDVYKGERLVYRSDRIYGIDISKHQHVKGKKKYAINWDRLRIVHLGNISKKTINGAVDYPISFVYIKSTEGSSLLNPYYKKDYVAAKAHGFKVGTYHFFSTLTPANKQASQFLKHSYVRRSDLPPVLDVEPTREQINKMGGTSVLFARMRVWLRIIEKETGKKPILYISQSFVNRYLSLAPDLKNNYHVWIARYGEYKPDVKMIYWQLCPDGKVSGIHGDVDVNVFNGYHDSFTQFVSSK